MPGEHVHFVTGRLAERALRGVLEALAPRGDFDYSVEVLPITVAALMTPAWIERNWHPPEAADRVLVPGYCGGDLSRLSQAAAVPVERGPKDLRQLPDFFGHPPRTDEYGGYDIEIIAEINHAPRQSLGEVLGQARRLRDSGADVIDVGCDPGQRWQRVDECVRALRGEGHRVSIDSFDPVEVQAAVTAGAELVLSVNSSNVEAALDWGCEVVVIPDDPATLGRFDETIGKLAAAGVPHRLDPILEPIGCGFAASLNRYVETRRRYPDSEIMMGIGNLTELTDVDSAGVNVMLLGCCQELGIRSVLTTEVINWARSSVRECDLARRLVYDAVRRQVPPKHIEPNLVTLRDAQVFEYQDNEIDELAARIKDHNYRLLVQRGRLHLLGGGLHLTDSDPFLLFEQLLASTTRSVDPAHAFYLGYELAKATTALALGKQYEQDEALDWGYLTVPETSHRERKKERHDS